jgi:hypothetical protein
MWIPEGFPVFKSFVGFHSGLLPGFPVRQGAWHQESGMGNEIGGPKSVMQRTMNMRTMTIIPHAKNCPAKNGTDCATAERAARLLA